jgi:muramoyltetrapeptide carboxypeptidase LdcA involved in peptidoglycan recycling
LRHLDYDLIRKHPKIFVGYSDNAHLIYALYVKAGLRSFFGPCVFTEFAEYPEPDPFTVDHFFQAVTGEGIVGKQVPYSTQFVHNALPFFDEEKGEDTQEVRRLLPTPPLNFFVKTKQGVPYSAAVYGNWLL